ncbi:hypothetical protein ETR_05388 [Erwinia tracheiphila PSU-1]|nr:hypothetical protein ETR_05388 [Erwinia tracheiphila PSU-1]
MLIHHPQFDIALRQFRLCAEGDVGQLALACTKWLLLVVRCPVVELTAVPLRVALTLPVTLGKRSESASPTSAFA